MLGHHVQKAHHRAQGDPDCQKIDGETRVSWIQKVTRKHVKSESFDVRMTSVILLKKMTGEVVYSACSTATGSRV